MKKIVGFFVIIVLLFPIFSFAGERVRGHWRDTNRDGIKDTYVSPHSRTSPNATKSDNYSTPGNYNPNKGEVTPGDRYRESSRDNYKPQKKYY